MKKIFSALILIFSTTSTFGATSTKIALLQYNADAHFGESRYNISALTQMVGRATASGAKLIVFPEGSTYGYTGGGKLWCKDVNIHSGCVDVRSVAEQIPQGPSTAYWSEIAKKNQIYILFSVPEVFGNDFYNTTGIVGPNGYVGKYHKRELYKTDQYYASRGVDPFVLETNFGRFGILICLDATYEGYLEDYKRAGLDSVILIMDWDDSPTGPAAATSFFRKRAREASIDIFASDVSPWDGTGFYRHTGDARKRDGLADPAIGMDGISYAWVVTKD